VRRIRILSADTSAHFMMLSSILLTFVCTYMHACMYIMYVCMYVCMYVRNVCMYACMHVGF
jgi:hypothetical protein